MAISSLVAAGLYVLRLILYVPKALGLGYYRIAEILVFGYTIALLGFILFAYLCRTLANLVKNAANLQEENELTI